MEKTVTIGDKDVRLSNRIDWAFTYRDQFGHDIIPTLMPMLASMIDIVGGILNETGKAGDVGVEDILKTAGSDAMTDALIHLSGLEFVELLNITWALAKTADDTIEEPRYWVRQFPEFPVDVIAPAVFTLIFEGVISRKNLTRLKQMTSRLRPSTSTPSSSQPLSEV